MYTSIVIGTTLRELRTGPPPESPPDSAKRCKTDRMIFDGYVHQLPDTDPDETEEWLDSLDAVIDTHGKTRARFLLSKLLERAREAMRRHLESTVRRIDERLANG